MTVYIFNNNNYYIGDNLSTDLKSQAIKLTIDNIPNGKTISIVRDSNNQPIVNFVEEGGVIDGSD